MDSYLLYITIASATIASPGPGVLLTISNSLKYGFFGSIAGILGIAIGMLGIAALSATSVAMVLANSAVAFNVLKYLGAAYLIYLGIKMWRSSSTITLKKTTRKNQKIRFLEGIAVTLLNPKPIFFFIALFPQFIDASQNHAVQFSLLVATFSSLVILIHCLYAATAKAAKSKLATPTASKLMNRTGGGFFICFGVGLAASNR